MSWRWRPFTPPLALATLNAASMPRFMFWPSSLAGPLKGAEIPNRISVSVTPRIGMLTLLGSCPSGCEVGVCGVCCTCRLAGGSAGSCPSGCEIGECGVCCACALAGGSAPEPAAIPVAGTIGRFTVSWSDLAPCNLSASALNNLSASALNSARASCHSGFAKMISNATTAANVTTTAIRPTSATPVSSRNCSGGSGMCSDHETNSADARRS